MSSVLLIRVIVCDVTMGEAVVGREAVLVMISDDVCIDVRVLGTDCEVVGVAVECAVMVGDGDMVCDSWSVAVIDPWDTLIEDKGVFD